MELLTSIVKLVIKQPTEKSFFYNIGFNGYVFRDSGNVLEAALWRYEKFHSNDDIFAENSIFPKYICSFDMDCLIKDNCYRLQLQSISD